MMYQVLFVCINNIVVTYVYIMWAASACYATTILSQMGAGLYLSVLNKLEQAFSLTMLVGKILVSLTSLGSLTASQLLIKMCSSK